MLDLHCRALEIEQERRGGILVVGLRTLRLSAR